MYSAAVLVQPGSAEESTDAALITNAILAKQMSRAKLSMLFEGETVCEFNTWQTRFRAKLDDILGAHDPPQQWTVSHEDQSKAEDHTRFDLLLEAEGVPSVPVYLLIPNGIGAGDRRPGVLCIHGHGRYGNHPIVGRTDLDGVAKDIDQMNYDYGLQFVRRGYVVVAPCMLPFGRRVEREQYDGNDPCAVTFVRMQALGKVLMTENLRDLRWALDMLASRPEVDPGRIGCAGLSYGGRMTMLLTAMDERVRVAAISGALNLQQERLADRHSCGAQIIPGLLNYGDYSEIGSLIAPRPCVWEVGSEDPLIVPKWDEVFRGRLRMAYRAADASNKLHFDRFDGGHQWSGRIAFPLFDEMLHPYKYRAPVQLWAMLRMSSAITATIWFYFVFFAISCCACKRTLCGQ